MIARYEQEKITDGRYVTVCTYKNLANLPHWHKEHELIFTLSGNCEVSTSTGTIMLNEGMSAFISGEELHYIKSADDSMVRIMKISPKFVRSITAKAALEKPLIENYYDVGNVMAQISEELAAELPYCHEIAGSLALKLLAEIFRSEATVPHCPHSHEMEDKFKALSDKTILEHHRLISTILAQAEKEMLVPYNAAAKATPPRINKKDPNYFQPETISAMSINWSSAISSQRLDLHFPFRIIASYPAFFR